MKCRTAIALVFPLVSSVGLAVSFDLKDENNDGMISRNEWQKPVTDADVYGNWDSNADSYIDENEFNDLDWDYDYELWDRNKDTHLDDNELYKGMFNAFDDNENGHWDDDEWDDAGDQGLFDI